MDTDSNGVLHSLPTFDQALGNFLASNEVGIVSVSLTAIVNIIKNILLVRPEREKATFLVAQTLFHSFSDQRYLLLHIYLL